MWWFPSDLNGDLPSYELGVLTDWTREPRGPSFRAVTCLSRSWNPAWESNPSAQKKGDTQWRKQTDETQSKKRIFSMKNQKKHDVAGRCVLCRELPTSGERAALLWEAILGGKNGYDTMVPRDSKGGTCKNGNYAFYHISHTDIGVFNGVTTGRKDLVSIKTGQFVPWFGAQAGGRWSALRAARRSV